MIRNTEDLPYCLVTILRTYTKKITLFFFVVFFIGCRTCLTFFHLNAQCVDLCNVDSFLETDGMRVLLFSRVGDLVHEEDAHE